jgi:GNAT superfamily N-acetyltransferase
MPSAAKLTIRDAQPRDRTAIVEVLTAAFADSDVARWLAPDPDTRRAHSLGYFRSTVDQAMSSGTPKVADERGEIVGAALWFPHPRDTPVVGALPEGAVFERLRLLEQLLDERHPYGPAHHHLAHLGVRPDRQRQGIGSCLLIGQHAYLHVAGISAYLEANDPRSHALLLRHGYTDLGTPIVPSTGLEIWPMWRPPVPAGVVPAAAVQSVPPFPDRRL